MEAFKQHIAKQFIGKRLKFKCDCIFPINHVGTIVDYELIKNEIIFMVDIDGKIVRLGENHPNLYVELV